MFFLFRERYGVEMTSTGRVFEMLDGGIWARKEDGLMAVLLPPNGVGRLAVDATHFKYLTVALMFTETVWVDDDSISNACSHDDLLWRASMVRQWMTPR
jgi:hypothetical protein